MASAFTQTDNHIFSFLTRTQDAVEDYYYFKKTSISEYRRNLGWAIIDTLTSTRCPLHYEMKSLNGQIIQLGDTHRRIKEVWMSFYASLTQHYPKINDVRKKFLDLVQEYSVDKSLYPFENTDLVAFPDHYEGQLPKNGILSSEFPMIRALYFRFIKKIYLDYNKEKYSELDAVLFRKQIFRNIRTIMTRPLGRELIRRIDESLKGILTIKAQDRFDYQSQGHVVGYAVTPEITYSEVAPGDIRSISDPSYMILIHEFIHLLHELEGSRGSHDVDPDLPAYYTNPEEWRTIKGFCRCHGYHEMSEESLRAEFNLYPRHTHLRASWPKNSPSSKLEQGAKAGAHQDIMDALPEIASPALDHSIKGLMDSNDNQAVENLVELALKNKSARKGKFLRCVESMPPLDLNSDELPFQKKARQAEEAFSCIVEKVKSKK